MPQDDNMGRKRQRAQHYQYIPPGHASGAPRPSHQSHPEGGCDHAESFGNMWIHPIDERIQQRYHHHRQAGEKSGFRRPSRFQPHGLKGVTGEQTDSRQDSAPGGTGAETPAVAKHPGQDQRRHQESNGDIEDGRSVVEGALDHDESGAPDQGVEYQRQVGAPDEGISDFGCRISGGIRGAHDYSRSNSASVKTIRFRARSRPSGRNHSLGVWALPPVPPAPMETAGMSRERGILASVEAQSRWERMPRWASTARTYARM